MSESSGLGGLFDKAKKAAKDLATDRNIDKAAAQVKKVAPKVGGYVDKAAVEAKKRNDDPGHRHSGPTGDVPPGPTEGRPPGPVGG